MLVTSHPEVPRFPIVTISAKKVVETADGKQLFFRFFLFSVKKRGGGGERGVITLSRVLYEDP